MITPTHHIVSNVDNPVLCRLPSLPTPCGRVVCTSVGCVYPGYQSYKTIKSRNVPEYRRWMQYVIRGNQYTCALLSLALT